MNIKNKIKKKKEVFIGNDSIIREAANIDDYKKILSVINNDADIKNNIIETEIAADKVLKHRKIKHIIHSGEYTESMAYDVTGLALDTAYKLFLKGVYSYDLLPHNYTFENGKWVLFDFGSFTLSAKNVKTQIRGAFKISFANFELLKYISRKDLKLYFLNRISHKNLKRMLPFSDWFKWYLQLEYALMMYSLKKYGAVYKYLIKVFEEYNKNYKKEIYKYNPHKEANKEIYDKINSIIQEKKDIFCIGRFAADWALYSSENIIKTVYLDNYEEADKYYNYICSCNVKNTAIGVLQPLTNDYKLSDNLKYRALYDDFTLARMHSAAVLLDFNEIYDDIYYSIEDFCRIAAEYSEDILIIKTDFQKLEKIQACLSQYFKEINIFNTNIAVFKNKTADRKQIHVNYENDNRGAEAEAESAEVIRLLSDRKIKGRQKLNN